MKRLLFFFIAVSLSITYFHLLRPHLSENASNLDSALHFSKLHTQNSDPFYSTWESRVFPCLLVGKVVDCFSPVLANTDEATAELHLEFVLAGYYTFWLFATFVLFHIFNPLKEAILLVLGTFSSCLYLIIKPYGMIILPWDLAAMFFITLAVYLYRNNRFWPFVLAVFLGSCFKETVLCCAALIFFFPGHRKVATRVFLFAALFGLKMLCNKAFLTLYYPAGHVYKPLTRDLYSHVPLVLINLKYFFQGFLSPWPHWAICSGLLFFTALFFWKIAVKLEYLLVLVLFLGGATVLGYWWETRIFTDIAALLWIVVLDYLCKTQSGSERRVHAAQASPDTFGNKPGSIELPAQPAPGLPLSTMLGPNRRRLLLISSAVGLGVVSLWLISRYVPGTTAAASRQESLVELLVPRAQHGSVEAQFKLAAIYQDRQDYTNAMSWYEKAAGNGYIVMAECKLGELYLEGKGITQDYTLASEHFERATKLSPDSAQAWVGLGRALAAQGKLADALPAFREFARLSPADPDAQVTLGQALTLAGQTNEATAAFARALELDPDLGSKDLAAGKALLIDGHLESALAPLAAAAALKPDDAEAHEQLGVLLSQLGKPEDAVRELEQSARLRPAAQVYYELAIARERGHQPAKAVTAYRQVLALDTNHLAALNNLAWLLATSPDSGLRDGAEAVRLAERARDLSGGKEACYWGTLDAAYAETGRWADAAQAAQKALDLFRVSGQTNLAEAATQRLALYAKQQPYHQ